MKILVISDCHLKPVMFDKADKILASGKADIAVQMGDLVDDWECGLVTGLYERTLERAIKFKEDHPDALWCLGNHDQGYLLPYWGKRESGHSIPMEPFVKPLIEQLPQKVIHIVDGIMFTHAGLAEDWVKRRLKKVGYRDGVTPSQENLIHIVNYASPEELWEEDSPIWVRPQGADYEMWPAPLQVVGHTPMKSPIQMWNVLSTDVHSTCPSGAPYGDRSFVIVDTDNKTWRTIKEDDD